MTSVNYNKGSRNDKPDSHGYQNATADPWEQSRIRNAVADDTLSSAQAVKNDAEHARHTIANEILEAAKTVCGELIADTERTLEKARFLEAEADRKHLESHEELQRSEEIRKGAEEYRDALIEEAKNDAEELLQRARSTADRETSEMKQRASVEADKMMAHARVMRDAAAEELEAQKIYAEAARFKADSQGTLSQARSRLDTGRTEALIQASRRPKPQKASAPSSSRAVKTNKEAEGADVDHQSKVNRAAELANALAASATPPDTDSNGNGHAGAIEALEQLRGMQKAASRAVDAALANKPKPKATKAKKKSPAKKKKTTS